MAAEHAARRRWMSALAQATGAELERAWQALPERPEYRVVRRPEAGLVMGRAPAGGSGAPFNLGGVTGARRTGDPPSGMGGHPPPRRRGLGPAPRPPRLAPPPPA